MQYIEGAQAQGRVSRFTGTFAHDVDPDTANRTVAEFIRLLRTEQPGLQYARSDELTEQGRIHINLILMPWKYKDQRILSRLWAKAGGGPIVYVQAVSASKKGRRKDAEYVAGYERDAEYVAGVQTNTHKQRQLITCKGKRSMAYSQKVKQFLPPPPPPKPMNFLLDGLARLYKISWSFPSSAERTDMWKLIEQGFWRINDKGPPAVLMHATDKPCACWAINQALRKLASA